MRRRTQERRGFALAVVLTTISVIAIGSVVILANLAAGERDRFRVSRAAQVLNRFKIEMGENGQSPSFRGDVGDYPKKLSQLSIPITIGDTDACGENYTGGGGGGEVNNWKGPYHLIPARADGVYDVARGFVAEDTLHRDPPTGSGNSAGELSIVMKSVSLNDAQSLGLEIDGVSTGVGPVVKFTINGNNAVTLYYAMQVEGC
jgi:hypothetical protein